MSSVKLGGRPYSIIDDIPLAGIEAPDFTFVKSDLSESSLYDDYEGQVKVLIGIPSIDTGVCQAETRKFNQEIEKREGVVGIVLSKDLPFAHKRFCEAEGINSVIAGSDYRYKDFMTSFNTEILSGPFKGLSARAVFVVDQNNKIAYSELVPEIGEEPEYDKVLAAVDSLL
ncbi:MAG: thiol peroxidase [Bacteroidia bacterium]|nr:thiol peroxidase [Bacteroidia bacterium]